MEVPMSRTLHSIGWLLVVVAVVGGALTIPVWNVEGTAKDGSISIESNPLRTTIIGNGQFTHEMFWSISWTAVAICGAMLVVGVWLVRRRPTPAASPALQSA